MGESAAVVSLRQELDNLGGIALISSLSIRAGWGQGNLTNLGGFRQFLQNYPEVFEVEGHKVKLKGYTPKAAKATPKTSLVSEIAVQKAVPAKEPPAKDSPVRVVPKDWAGAGQGIGGKGSGGKGGKAAPLLLQPKAKADALNTMPAPKYGPDGKGQGKAGFKFGATPITPPPSSRKRLYEEVEDDYEEDEGEPEAKAPKVEDYEDESMVDAPGLGNAPKVKGVTSKAMPPKMPAAFDKGGKGAFGKGGGKEATFQTFGMEKAGKGLFEKGGKNGFKGKGSAPIDSAMEASGKGMKSGKESPSAWEEDMLTDEELSRFIAEKKVRGIELELSALAARIAPSPEHVLASQKLVELLESAVASQWPSRHGLPPPTLEVVGAVAQSTDIDGSEVDILLRLDPSMPPEEREVCIEEFRESLRHHPQLSSEMLERPGLQTYPHATCPLTVEWKTEGNHPIMAHVLLADAIADGSQRPVTIDDAIKRLCDAADVARDLVRLVKLWATNHGMCSHHEYYPNGLSWALLALFSLQQQQLLPSLKQLASGSSPPLENVPSLQVLFRGFFELIAARATTALRGVSVVTGQEFDTSELGPAPVFLEDPAELRETGQQRNLVENVGEQQWARICDEAKKAGDKLSARPPQKWLNWAEIFDPRAVPVDKSRRLQSLQEEAVQTAQAEAAQQPTSTGEGDTLDEGQGPDLEDGKAFDAGKGAQSGKGAKGFAERSDFDGEVGFEKGKGFHGNKGCEGGKGAFSGKSFGGAQAFEGGKGKGDTPDDGQGPDLEDGQAFDAGKGAKGGKGQKGFEDRRGFDGEVASENGKGFHCGKGCGGGKDNEDGKGAELGKSYGGGKAFDGGKGYGFSKGYDGGKGYESGKNYDGGKSFNGGKGYDAWRYGSRW